MNDPATSRQGTDKNYYLKAVASYGVWNPLVGVIACLIKITV